MKKKIILLGTLIISGVAFSQVGINTANPQGIFNIDGVIFPSLGTFKSRVFC